jgi:hypothetical protein
VQKRVDIKYSVYKLAFSLVLCAFFFVQTQAAFIAHAYNDYRETGVGHFEKSNSGSNHASASAGITSTPVKYKLNKRYHPETAPALLQPCSFVTGGRYVTTVKAWVMLPFIITAGYNYHHQLRGPPFFNQQ